MSSRLFGSTVTTAALAAMVGLSACEGPIGPAGADGPPGADGAAGADGQDGSNGADGQNGAAGADGQNGADGQDGQDGADGADGADATVDPLLPPIDKAFVGIGGEAALVALTGFELTTSGSTGLAYEGYTPADFFAGATTFDTVVQGDLAADAWRLDVERDAFFFGFPVPQTFSEVIDGPVGEIVGAESILGFPTVMTSDRWASIRRNQRFLNPHLLLRDVADDPSLAADAGDQLLDGSVHHLVVVADDVAPITLWVNAATGHIDKLTTWENDPTFSDVPVEVFYYGWTVSDGALLFPSQVYVAVDGQIVRTETRTGVAQVNPAFPAGTFDVAAPVPFDASLAARGTEDAQFHQQFAGVGIPLDGLQDAVTATELTPGVWHLTTASHHALIVEQSAGFVLFDAPLYPELGEAILDWAAQQAPSKPITHVVVSHFHRDHVGGLRALVAAGATVVAHEDQLGYYDDLFTRARTIQPDALSVAPVAATFVPVPDGGMVSLADPQHPVEVYAITSSHAADMVVPYVADAQIAFSVDIYSPGFGVNPLALELHDALADDWALPVALLAGGHGFGTQTWAGFEAELAAAGLL